MYDVCIDNVCMYVQLYAPWCEYSQLALDEFIPTVQYIVDKNISDMVVGKIDIIKNNGEAFICYDRISTEL